MTEIERKALALVNEVWNSCMDDLEDFSRGALVEALLRAIEQHEAFRQKVSDAVDAVSDSKGWPLHPSLWRFVIAKPDPLVEALGELADRNLEARQAADTLRAAIEKRGGKIVWGEGA